MKILIGTNNKNKLEQYRRTLERLVPDWEILSLLEAGIDFDVEEDGDDLLYHAKKKAEEYGEMSGLFTISDDTGLFVDALGGEPGIHAKRWAEGTSHDRCLRLLERMKDVPGKDRTVQYRAVVAGYDPKQKKSYSAETVIDGLIVDEMKGENGFGYDPIFFVNQFGKRFAELSKEDIDSISHRTIGTKKVIEEYLNKNEQKRTDQKN